MSSRTLAVIMQENLAGELPMILDRDGQAIPCNETNRRIALLAAGLRRVPGSRFARRHVNDTALDATIGAIHGTEYRAFVEEWSGRLEGEQMLLFGHPYIPEGVGPDTPIVPGIFDTARESARTAIGAAMLVAEGASMSYALCRPPGHHAGPSWLGGHCYLNNAVLAMVTLMNHGVPRVGLIDFDIHFGNGSAAILAHMPDTFFGSIHSSTLTSYPYIPTAPLTSAQVYVPFDGQPTPGEFLGALDMLIEGAADAGCEALVISAGYDIIAGDPHGTWSLAPGVLREVGKRFAAAGLPLCIVQEGGYLLSELEHCAYEFGMGLLQAGAHRPVTARAHEPVTELFNPPELSTYVRDGER